MSSEPKESTTAPAPAEATQPQQEASAIEASASVPAPTVAQNVDEDVAPVVPVDQRSISSDSDSAYDSDQLVKEYKFENGRRYHAYHSGAYNFPNDDSEQDRLDMFHHIIQLGCEGKLYLAPIKCDGLRILDIGCGTGIWAIQMGDEYPSANITGNDLSPIQPGWVSPNVRFLVDDIEQDWAENEKYDYIHSRYIAASIKDWPHLVKQYFENLKPGGWVEFQDYDTACISQDNTMPKEYAVDEMLSLLRGALDSIGRLLDPGPHLKGWVENAGFENITHRIIPLPVGIWPKDKKQKEIGAFMTLQYTEGVEAFTMAPFTGILGLTKEEVDIFNMKVRKDAKDRKIHVLHNYHVVYAQKHLNA